MLGVGGSLPVIEVTSRTRQLLLAFSHAMLTDASQYFCVTGAPQLLLKKASETQEDVGQDTEGREGQRGAEWIQPLHRLWWGGFLAP
ncbi:hypothetical protein INR49_019555 [Caranx melampygus]|nr:hypothetical protein INR49_019555 [Caranx melampygus]